MKIGTHDRWFVQQYRTGRITLTPENRVQRVSTGTLIDRVSKSGYYVAFLNDTETRQLKTIPAHRLVWMVRNKKFIPKGVIINHVDGSKTNDNVSNLELSSHSENNSHAHTLQLNSSRGEKNSRALYSEKQVKNFRKEFATTGITPSQMAKREDVSRMMMWQLLKGISYPERDFLPLRCFCL